MTAKPPSDLPVSTTHENEPPVIARMVVEIRSDGSRTIARGAMEDTTTGERVNLHAEASTPIALAAQLMKSVLQVPLLAKTAAKSLLPGWLSSRHK